MLFYIKTMKSYNIRLINRKTLNLIKTIKKI